MNNTRELAGQRFRAGQTIAEISRALGRPQNTIQSWKRRDGWDITDATGRLKQALLERCETLIAQADKTEADWQEIDRLTGYVERLGNPPQPRPDRAGSQKQRPAIDLGPVPTIDNPPRGEPDAHEGKKRGRGRPKASEKNVLTPEDCAALVDAFHEAIFPYQRRWWEAREHDGRIILKSRQIGATYYFALEALIVAITTGKNQIFVSASKKQAAQFRRNILRFVKKVLDIDLQGDPMRLILPGSEAGEVYLFFLGTQVSSVQGYSGDLYLDECGWVRNFASIQEVASAMSLQAAYRETYFTTPSTMDHDFYAFWTGAEYNKDRPKAEQISIDTSHAALKDGQRCADGYWRQIVTIEDAIAQGCTLFDLEKVKRKYSPARYAMLCLCQFVDHTASVFSFRLLSAAMVEAFGRWPDYHPLSTRPLGDTPCWLGYDPSGEGDDAAALVVLAPPSPGSSRYRVVEVLRLEEADYPEQFDQVQRLRARYHITYIGIDNQGVGDGVYQMVRNVFPLAEAIRYSPESKAAMIAKALTLLKRGLLEIDNVYLDDVLPAMLSLQRSSTSAGTPTYTARRSDETGHADVAWALLHAINHAEFDSLLDEEQDESLGGFIEIC
jgi:uncharacterized protein YjcR